MAIRLIFSGKVAALMAIVGRFGWVSKLTSECLGSHLSLCVRFALGPLKGSLSNLRGSAQGHGRLR